MFHTGKVLYIISVFFACEGRLFGAFTKSYSMKLITLNGKLGPELQISSWSLLIASSWRWDGRNVQMHCLFRKKIMGFLVFAFFTICLSDS